MTVVLVEGTSDRVAVEAVARRAGIALRDVRAVGGAHALGRALAGLGAETRVAGLYDEGEEQVVLRALDRVARPREGFFACVPDLEGELIRAVGADTVLRIAEEHRDLHAFRTMQQQPEWRGRPVDAQLRRWLGSGGGRKLRYAQLLADALDLGRLPRPLARLLDYVEASRSAR